jgi:hypothetical protein
MTTFANEGTGKVFCLCEAPSKEAAKALPREAHGGVADEITEVKEVAWDRIILYSSTGRRQCLV